jgi:hypothetical protein
MSKADGDPRTRDVAVPGRDRAGTPAAVPNANANAESSNVKSNAAVTREDDIPPVHVLEAAQDQDRKEAEDLLAGFDRPGLRPKATSKERDFVDYYAKKKKSPSAGDAGAGAGAGAGRGPGAAGASAAAASPPTRPRQIDVATVITPRKSEGAPAWLVWAAVGLVMLIIGGAVAFLATWEGKAVATDPVDPSGTSTTAAAPLASPGHDGIPPPDPPAATGTTTTPLTIEGPATATGAAGATTPTDAAVRSATKPRVVTTGAAAAAAPAAATPRPPHDTSAADGTKPPPRDDFIRDL